MATVEQEEGEHLYKTKMIEFLGRTTPIILQNDNGPCPLLAICNVLLLKNGISLDASDSEVSMKTLLSLVADKIMEPISNSEDKDAANDENRQKNISDAIDRLPLLATGIDVNIRFRRIDDFEFTPECAIFDLLHIPLYHGWIVDPQDYDTANAISSKSYNTLMEKLVALETRHIERELNSDPEEDSVDFVAATTATLGVPSPCLSRTISFNDSPGSVFDHQKRKGDLEEEAELLRVLELSNAKLPTTLDDNLLPETNGSALVKNSNSGVLADAMEHRGDGHQLHQPEISVAQASSASSSCDNDRATVGNSSTEINLSFSKNAAENHNDCLSLKDSAESSICSDSRENMANDAVVQNISEPLLFKQGDPSSANKDDMHGPGGEHQAQQCLQEASASSVHVDRADHHVCDTSQSPGPSEGAISCIDDSEPIYEGEDRILDSRPAPCENQEPMYEGEVVLAEQAERGTGDSCNIVPMDEVTEQQGLLIGNFLRSSASQLTIFGLFCLQEGLKERELCVFFRNNHFNTMFKYNGELYLLATDQGYISQPDLVWEKLNEVNGDTVFMTGGFREFKVDNHLNEAWDEHKAMSSTTDFLASIENSEPTGSALNSDLQLAIELQQKEFENQQQRQHTSQQSSGSGNSRLLSDLQVPNSNGSQSSVQQDAKTKDKCVVM